MPNYDAHWPIGAASGGTYALYMGYGQQPSHVLAETLGGALGGFVGGVLPDRIDTPYCPRHRAEAHSMAITGSIGCFLKDNLPKWQGRLRVQAGHLGKMRAERTCEVHRVLFLLGEYTCRFLAGLIAGVLAGYASHLILDFFTPISLPIC